jgi:nucleotide-binding universal stress UspA family protein
MPSHDERSGIVVGVDDSPAAKAAVEWAARDAELRSISLTLVHAVSPNLTTWQDDPLPPGLAQWQKNHGRRLLEDAIKIVEKACHHGGPTQVHTKVLSSAAVATLTDLSRDAELMVVGSSGTSGWQGRTLGSVSSGLIRHAHCPVVITRDDDPASPQQLQAPVLVGVDGSPGSELATAIAFDEASRRNVGLIALHAWSDVDVSEWPGLDWPLARAMSEDLLTQHLAGWRAQYPDVDVRQSIVRDQPAHQLVTHSAEAQLLVVGSHGRGGFSGMLAGSVSESVAQLAHTPVIVVRQAGP